MAAKVRKKLFDNVSLLNTPEEHQRSGKPSTNPEDPIGSINSSIYQETTPRTPDRFRAEVIEVVEDVSFVEAMLGSYFYSDGETTRAAQKIYKIRCDLVGHLQDPNNFEEGSDERNFYMSLHPDASLDFGIFDNPDILPGDEVICYYEDPSRRGSIRIDEVVPRKGNDGSTTAGFADNIVDGAKDAFSTTTIGRAVSAVTDMFTGTSDTDFRVPTDMPSREGYTQWTNEDTSLLGEAVRSLLVPAATKMTSPYGSRIHPVRKTRQSHGGIDIAVDGKEGHKIISPRDGVVQVAISDYKSHPKANRTWVKNGGNQVWVTHDAENGKSYSSRFLHLQNIAPNLRVGDKVSKGQVIGTLGNTGIGTGPHLHYTVRDVTGGANKKVNPLNILMNEWFGGSKTWIG